ncbi:unnamed protein product [Medioppia subpectinata]|uniref:Uncharacterized protein n=1 Tax=Medioppia subpectinata TaxID=1979941 RepID=A0A7R9QMX0_9ACAR|nr:unnamed protein product [Medioppia subpectinata]CAG2123565.1 unnamed protein product [Medioppia subpectinata]
MQRCISCVGTLRKAMQPSKTS